MPDEQDFARGEPASSPGPHGGPRRTLRSVGPAQWETRLRASEAAWVRKAVHALALARWDGVDSPDMTWCPQRTQEALAQVTAKFAGGHS